MTNVLYKAIMVRSRLRNKFLRLKTIDAEIAYKKQRNHCVSILRNTKKHFYGNLNPNLVSDNKRFWKQVKPLFSDKAPMHDNISLFEQDEIITEEIKCAEILNNFFISSVRDLDIDRCMHTNLNYEGTDQVENILHKFKNHPSIIKIKEQGFIPNSFDFKNVSSRNVFDIIGRMNSSKAYQVNNIPPKLLKQNADICSSIICKNINDSILKGVFPKNLKLADITPIFKREERLTTSLLIF